jgi:hypothetical protein
MISFHFEIRAKGNGNDMFLNRRMQIESRENTRKIYSDPGEGCIFFPHFCHVAAEVAMNHKTV